MKKLVIVPVWNRPHYTLQVLDSVLLGHEYDVLLGCEPGSPVARYLERCPKARTILRDRPSFNENVWNLFKAGFDGYDFVVYTEDDIVLSPDWFHLADFYAGMVDSERYACGGLWMSSGTVAFDFPQLVITRAGYAWPSKAFCVTKAQWQPLKSYVESHWPTHTVDITWGNYNQKHPLGYLSPVLSRALNIGRVGGVWTSEERFDSAWNWMVASKHKDTQNWIILP